MTESIIKAHPEFVSIREKIDRAIAGLIQISESDKQALLKRMEDLAEYNINTDALKLYKSLPDYPDFLDSHEFSSFKKSVHTSEKLLDSLTPKANESRYNWLIKLIEFERKSENLLQEMKQKINLLEDALEGQEEKPEEPDDDCYPRLESLHEKISGLLFQIESPRCENSIRLFGLSELVDLVGRLKSREHHETWFIAYGITFLENNELQFKNKNNRCKTKIGQIFSSLTSIIDQILHMLTSLELEENDVLMLEIDVEDLKKEVEEERIKSLDLYEKNKDSYYGQYGWLKTLDVPKNLYDSYKRSIESYKARLKIVEKRRKKLAEAQPTGLENLFDGITVSKLNWELLEGCTFEKIHKELVEYYRHLFSLDKIDFYRLEKIVELKPCEVYLGVNTFKGFICFRFHKTEVVVLEKPVYGNATYLISKDWESLSRFSRSSLLTFFPEVVSRCIHRNADDWFDCVKAGLNLKNF